MVQINPFQIGLENIDLNIRRPDLPDGEDPGQWVTASGNTTAGCGDGSMMQSIIQAQYSRLPPGTQTSFLMQHRLPGANPEPLRLQDVMQEIAANRARARRRDERQAEQSASPDAHYHSHSEDAEFDEYRDLRDIRADIDRHPKLAWLKPTTIGDGSGLDAVVMVLRYILTQLPSDARMVKDVEAEEQNPILSYAFKHFTSRLIDVARQPYLRAITENPAANPKGLSFLDIMEGELMRATFWSRELYRLFLRQMPIAYMGGDDFDVIESDDPLAIEAARSLVVWDGTTSLSDHLSHLSSRRRFGRVGVDCFRLMRFPFIIRVLVTPPEGVTIDFTEIRSADVQGHFPAVIANGRATCRLSDPAWYGLLAVVRLRNDASEPDLVRLYDRDGYRVRAPAPCNHVDDDWRFGVPGHSYMVYLAGGSEGRKRTSRLSPPQDQSRRSKRPRV